MFGIGVQSHPMTMRPTVAVLLLAAACGSSSTPQVSLDGGPPDAPAAPNVQTIGALGGTVRLPGGEAALTIPPGALDGAFTFSINPGAQAGSYDFAPAGVWFRVAATVTLA